jgi:hypothetical protein
MIPGESHYHLIPSLPSLFLAADESEGQSLGWERVAAMARASASLPDKVVDFSSALRIRGCNRQVRVFLKAGTILGVRPCLVADGPHWTKWDRFEMQALPLPPVVSAIAGQASCPLGEFILEFENSKLAPFFGSEVRALKDIFHVYSLLGVEIYSVTDFPTSTQQYSGLLTQLVHHSSEGTAFIYASPQGALSLTEVYGGGSCIALGTKLLALIPRLTLEPVPVISAAVDLDSIKRRKVAIL